MTVSARIRTLAKTGRLTEIAANHCMMTQPSRCTRTPSASFPRGFGGDLLAGLDAGGQLDAVADLFTERHDALFNLVVLGDDVDPAGAGDRLDGRRRHEHRRRRTRAAAGAR